MTINLWDAVCEYFGEDLCIAVAKERFAKLSKEEQDKIIELKGEM